MDDLTTPPMPDIFRKSQRLHLRPFTANDLSLLIELDRDPEVMRYLNPGAVPDEGNLRDEILPRWLQWYQEYDDLGFWAAHESATDNFIGWFHLRFRGDPGALELGYRLKKCAWGKGYATEMSLALVQVAFGRPETQRVEATAMAANKASIRVMQKVGLHFVEVYIENAFRGDDKRAVRYRLTREQFEKSVVTAQTSRPQVAHPPES